jgi:acetate kinase
MILTINAGSSSVKFAVFETGKPLRRILAGTIDRIGTPEAVFVAEDMRREIAAGTHEAAGRALMEWLEERVGFTNVRAVGHRIVHGGPKYSAPARITPEMIEYLRALSPFDPEHLPEEIELVEALFRRFPDVPQVACFDTAFHHNLPLVAQLLPIPRAYFRQGVRRYGFHGLSYEYLMSRPDMNGRVILAHLGNGASMAAVRDGRPVDTSMAFTPAAGFPMSSRSGDLDPDLLWYLARTGKMTLEQIHTMVNHESGLLGVSETSSDMRDLLERETTDERAADAVAMFCYYVRKWIGAFAAALGGLDTLVFTGGIGENAPVVRARICGELGYLGIELDGNQNAANADVISNGRVTVRVIHTDEELMIAKAVWNILEAT